MTKPGPGALVWAGFDGPQVPGPLLDAIRDGRIGGLLLFAYRGNIRSKAQVRAMLAEATAAARRGGLTPVPVALDQEGGPVVRVGYRAVFPSAMAIGATGDPAYAERAARAVAEGLLADGFTVNHAPVCDVNTEPRNPVIGPRSFGDDPDLVAAFAAAWVRGSERAGVATSPKHFPGHGATSVDSHLATPEVSAEVAVLRARELVPFRAAIQAGASMVMTAHIRYPALDPDDIATLSRTILNDVLRGELGFQGLTITDSLDMQGARDAESPALMAARAITAGIDAVMLTTGVDLQLAAAAAITDGVSPARVTEAIRRATVARDRFAGLGPREDIDDGPARALAAEIAARSITHVGPPLPDLTGRVRVTVVPFPVRTIAEELPMPPDDLEAALRRRFGDRLAFERDGRVPGGEGPLVVCTTSAWHSPEQAELARALLADGGILCALRSPYDATLFPDRPALLTYGDVPASIDAVAAVLAGEWNAPGRCPVRLP
ncbi:MAG: glycoside hydrolase family 3 protein [Candidatus Limnocylindria bacterium]